MNNQGLLVLGEKGELSAHQNSFGGLSEIYNTFMLDIAGACETPVSRLYGRTITGLGQSGEGDLQVYYDTVEQKRGRELRPLFEKLYPVIAMSVWGEIPKDFDFNFPPMRSLSHQDKADLATKTATAIQGLYTADLLTKYQAVKEIKQTSETTGVGSNITDENLAELQKTGNTYASEVGGGGELDFGIKPDDDEVGSGGSAGDSFPESVTREDISRLHGLNVRIATRAGQMRRGNGWSRRMPADYGEILGVLGADGDCLDCYVGIHPESTKVWIIDQLKLNDKSFDENKVMLAYDSVDDALGDYKAGHSKAEIIFGGITGLSMGHFKELIAKGRVAAPMSDLRGSR